MTLFNSNIFAQDDLLLQLKEESMDDRREPVQASFKGDRIINVQTNETVKKKNLDVRVSHLFGNIGKKSGGGFHNLYGFDQSQDIRISLHYGITDRLMAGFGRTKRHENLEGLLKYKLLQQSIDNSMPVSVTLFGNTTFSARAKELVEKDVHRLTYNAQCIITRKFSRNFSMVIVPSYLHRNFVAADDENGVLSLGTGMRIKFTPSSSIIFDYYHTFGRDVSGMEFFDPIGAGVEIETGGHVFTLMFTNASGIIENDFLVNTMDDWGKGGMKFSFIISRMFKVGS
ncbi:MAG: hypothetical protein DWQ44_02075 [Bacteroidetes bacterium]|nr:MAG: hypothetical protein DWQ33_05805 [Bacteroidota bacterium]REK04762.1 MAG: hypothetical protein DWQ39_05970 [Bacteroidota bacterium]REK36236.1 MAG: hypothetical protein DWQ44_02075 [Bacteroidota bacterium]